MSLYQLFKNVIPRLTQGAWGSQIKDQDGQKRDTGVNEFAEEVAALLASPGAFQTDEPLRIVKNYTGPAFEVVTDPKVPAGEDPLSNEVPGEISLTLDDVAQAAEDAQTTADAAAVAAANPAAQVFPGIVKTQATNETGKQATGVQIYLGGSKTTIQAYPWIPVPYLAVTVGTPVVVYPVNGDKVILDYFADTIGLGSQPQYIFHEPHTRR